MIQPIERILIKNFKSIQHIQLNDFKRINVFFGGPNSGKSNLLEALAVFSLPFLTKNPSKLISRLIRLEHVSELFYEGGSEEPIIIETNIGMALLTADPNGGLRVEIRDVNGSGDYRVDGQLNFRSGQSNKLLPEVKKYSFPARIRFGKGQAPFLIPPFGDNLMEIIDGYPVLRNEISGLLKNHQLMLVFDKEGQTMKLRPANRSKKDPFLLPYDSLSETLRRIIFFKAAIASNQDSVILLEEPDAHVFPSYIPMITQEMIYKRDNQYFMTTQTPDFLIDFLEDCPEELAVFRFNYQNHQTEVSRLITKEILGYFL